MTRKDYVAIAKVIHSNDRPAGEECTEYSDDKIQTCHDIAIDLCDIFAADNPNFNRVKFLEACKGRGM